jgi:hypothetical protein
LASSANDLCPGVPDPCVVSSKFSVVDGTTLDLGGKGFRMTGTAQLLGEDGASFSIIGTTSIALDRGSVVSANGMSSSGGNLNLVSTGNCDVSGRLTANGLGDSSAGTGAAGGGVDLSCDGSVSLRRSAVIEANGAFDAGGHVTITAGGDVTMLRGSMINAQGKGGASGGSLAISSGGQCTVASAVQVDGKSAFDGLVWFGGEAGSFQLTCAGNIALTANAKIIAGTVKGASAGAGRVGIHAGDGYGTATLDIAAGSKIELDGSADTSDGLGFSADGSCTLGGRVQANADSSRVLGVGAGRILAQCAGFTLGQRAVLELNVTGGEGGLVVVDTTGVEVGAGPGPCTIAGDISAKASAINTEDRQQYGQGGSIELHCGTTIDVATTAAVNVSGYGGDTGVVATSQGGSITIEAGGAATIAGNFTTTGKTYAGLIRVTAYGIGVTGVLNASAVSGGGGQGIELRSELRPGRTGGDVTIGNRMLARVPNNFDMPGNIYIEGCNVTIQDQGLASVDGRYGGGTQMIAHDTLTIAGHLSAASGSNLHPGEHSLKYLVGVSIPDATHVKPGSIPTQDLNLRPCS